MNIMDELIAACAAFVDSTHDDRVFMCEHKQRIKKALNALRAECLTFARVEGQFSRPLPYTVFDHGPTGSVQVVNGYGHEVACVETGRHDTNLATAKLLRDGANTMHKIEHVCGLVKGGVAEAVAAFNNAGLPCPSLLGVAAERVSALLLSMPAIYKRTGSER